MTRDLGKCDPVCKYPVTHRHYHPLLEDASGSDIGERSPLWTGLQSLFPDWTKMKVAQKKIDDAKIKPAKEDRATLVKEQQRRSVERKAQSPRPELW